MVKISQDVLVREKSVRQYIEKYSSLFGLDPHLIRAIISQESRFVSEATSPTGAYGFGQFTTIGAKQVQNISEMLPAAADLRGFTKQQADQPDKGIKAICATIWWLMNRKYAKILDKKVQLEATVTFYNAGGRPAALVIKHGGHAEAKEAISQLPRRYQSQSIKYAPEVSAWFVAWHEYFTNRVLVKTDPSKLPQDNPFDHVSSKLLPSHRALIETLVIMALKDDSADCIVNSRDGLTEITLIFSGELD